MSATNNSNPIGKVSATERNPSTIDDFYFWTKAGYKLSPFDVIKVDHIDGSTTFGQIEEICHVTDSSSHFSSYISSDFGNTVSGESGNTTRVQFNYVKATVIGNDKNIYTPVLHDSPVRLCTGDDIRQALGLDKVKNKLTCGYLEMYGERVNVDISADFLLGPDGAHMNVSGISGLAAKTSYTMFLLNSLQQKYMKMEDKIEKKKSIAFVLFNVKGKDLLSIDEEGSLSEDEKEKYKRLGLEPTPFRNVHYYYPFHKDKEKDGIYSYAGDDITEIQFTRKNALKYKYQLSHSKDKIKYLFVNEDDATGTMEGILSKIDSEDFPFIRIQSWTDFRKRVEEGKNNATQTNIPIGSWRKFARIVDTALHDSIFSDSCEEKLQEVDLSDALRNIRSNEVHVVDIARLDDKLQAFVFGDVVQTINELMKSKDDPNTPDRIVIFVDELNKYASNDVPKDSPILRQLLDITERGRSIGVILFGVEQFRSAIHPRIKGNCSTSAYGKTSTVEASTSDYSHIKGAYKSMVTRLEPGEYIVSNPALRSLIKINFPRPVYKENK